jgi:hypothetical protein
MNRSKILTEASELYLMLQKTTRETPSRCVPVLSGPVIWQRKFHHVIIYNHYITTYYNDVGVFGN